MMSPLKNQRVVRERNGEFIIFGREMVKPLVTSQTPLDFLGCFFFLSSAFFRESSERFLNVSWNGESHCFNKTIPEKTKKINLNKKNSKIIGPLWSIPISKAYIFCCNSNTCCLFDLKISILKLPPPNLGIDFVGDHLGEGLQTLGRW